MFKDGGINENNPAGVALSEYHALYAVRADYPALLLSIGAGRPGKNYAGPLVNIPGFTKLLGGGSVSRNLSMKLVEGEKQHKQMREYAHGEHTWYKRLDFSAGLEKMSMDDWQRREWLDDGTNQRTTIPGGSTLTRIEEATRMYLERPFGPAIDSYAPPMTMLKQAAQKLVLQRRAREEMGPSVGYVRW